MRKLLLFTFIFIVLSAFAQKKVLTTEAIMTDRTLYPERLEQMQWGYSNTAFYYVKSNRLIAVDKKGKDKELISLENINAVLSDHALGLMKRFPTITVLDDNNYVFMNDSLLIKFDKAKKKADIVNVIYAEAENTDIEYEKHNVAFTIENNLYISVKGKVIQLTDEKDKGIVYGKSVHREEFGIEKGTFWSPKGNYLAFYKMDESMVSSYPLVIIDDPIAYKDEIRYPTAGTANHLVSVGIYDTEKHQTLYLQTKHWDDQYLTNISWSPDENYIYIAVLNRNQKEMMLNQYRVSDGAFVKTIFSETHSKYVEPQHPLFFTDKTGNEFIWQSQRDGFNHLYLYNVNGHCVQLTKGRWVVNEILGISKDKKQLFISASKELPIESEVYSVDMMGKGMKKLSKEKGTNGALLSKNGSFLINYVSNTDISNRITLMDDKGIEISVLLKENPKLKDYLLPMELLSIKAADGTTDLYGRIIKPLDFDSGKKYPVIVYVYGGPHAQMVSNSWTGGAGLFLHYLAQQGYVVFTLDNRGSGNRGLDFEQAIYLHIGEIESEDQMEGIKYLRGLSYVDTTRIGVHGWSYGGYMAINLMLKHPDIFKVGVAGGPVTDWKYYEVMYGERYMSTPAENPTGYENSSLLNHIQDLKGKLLVIHGDNDPVVLWQHSLMLLKKAVKKRVLLDYFVYPGHEHNVGGIDRAHLMRKIETYFNDYL